MKDIRQTHTVSNIAIELDSLNGLSQCLFMIECHDILLMQIVK